MCSFEIIVIERVFTSLEEMLYLSQWVQNVTNRGEKSCLFKGMDTWYRKIKHERLGL